MLNAEIYVHICIWHFLVYVYYYYNQVIISGKLIQANKNQKPFIKMHRAGLKSCIVFVNYMIRTSFKVTSTTCSIFLLVDLCENSRQTSLLPAIIVHYSLSEVNQLNVSFCSTERKDHSSLLTWRLCGVRTTPKRHPRSIWTHSTTSTCTSHSHYITLVHQNLNISQKDLFLAFF